jgi:putative FmdB family regulatory protein
MPLYEYECKQCKRHTEHIQKFSDPEITQCPYCGALLERVISAPAIAFKGGGWFADGYGNAKPKSSGDSAKESSNSGSSTASSSETTGSSSKDTTASPASSGNSSSPAPAATAAPSTSSSDKK